MDVDLERLRKELEFLRKGAGLRHPALLSRLGPNIRLLSGISVHDTAAIARTKIVDKVEELLRDEPAGVLLVVLVALAGHPRAVQATLGERILWLSSDRRYQPRTARRRIDDAFEVLLHAAAASFRSGRGYAGAGRSNPADWWLRSSTALLRLRAPGSGVLMTELSEERTVVFAKDGVEALFCEFSLPRPACTNRAPPAANGDPRRLDISVVHGGTIREVRRATDQHYEFTVELPRRFGVGQSHSYMVRYRLPDGQPMAPHYVLQPFVPCESFDLTVCFDRTRPPRVVWQLDGVAPRLLDEPEPRARVLPLDRLAQVRASFRELSPGRSYGVKWVVD
jgi:hypothetical protein